MAEAAARGHTHLADQRRPETVATELQSRLAGARPGTMRTFDPYAEEPYFNPRIAKPEACHFGNSGLHVFDLSGLSEDDDLRLLDRPSKREPSDTSPVSLPWLSPKTWWWFGKYWLRSHNCHAELDQIDCENAEITEFIFRNGRMFEVKVGEEPGFWERVKAFLRV